MLPVDVLVRSLCLRRRNRILLTACATILAVVAATAFAIAHIAPP